LVGASDDEYDSLVDHVLSALVNQDDDAAVADAAIEALDHLSDPASSTALARRESDAERVDRFVRRVREWWNTVPQRPRPPLPR
jgi:hypothetical protein